ncbi:tetratricopeptide repeat protein [bacterium]|nr:tetratricopeptide repeat protein [bacterium]
MLNNSLYEPLFYLGKIYSKKKQPKAAIAHYKKLLQLQPNHFGAHLLLSSEYMKLKENNQALAHGLMAIKVKPNNVHAYLNTGHAYNKKGEMDKAITMYQRAIELAPNLANAHYNLGYTLKIRGDLPNALKSLNRALELNPEYIDAHIARAQTYWALEDFDKAFKDYKWRWKLTGRTNTDQKLWDGKEDLNGKKIVLYCEQGLGDTIQFIRYAKLIKQRGAYVICKVQKPLLDLLGGCSFIDKLITNFDQAPHNLRVALMDLPGILGMPPQQELVDIPYLQASKKLTNLWEKELSNDKNLKVGICWHVDPKHEKIKCPSAMRSISLQSLESIANIDGVSFYSLQKLNGIDQLKNKPENMSLYTFDGDFDNSHGRFMDTAALIKNLDLIITVDTSIAHVAGALGKPVWMLLPFSPDCRWYLNRKDTPWYPTMKLFRQKKPGTFDVALKQIAHELKREVKKQHTC